MQLGDGVKLTICMVGISGSGKSYDLFKNLLCFIKITSRYVANKICRFLKWKGYDARVFSCTEIRKKNHYEHSTISSEYWTVHNAEVIFSFKHYNNDKLVIVNKQYKDLQFRVLNETMEEMFQYLREGGQVGILDGSNLSHSTRQYIMEKVAKEVSLLFFIHNNSLICICPCGLK